MRTVLFVTLTFTLSLAACSHGDGPDASTSDADTTMTGPRVDAGSSDAAPGPDLADPLACVAFGASCKPGDACCKGTCLSTPTYHGACCGQAGDTCDPTAVAADAYCCPGNVCDKGSSRCTAKLCYGVAENCALGAPYPALPCCDSGAVCTPLAIPGSGGVTPSRCCAPNGTILSKGSPVTCCSYGQRKITPDTFECVPIPGR